MKKKNINITGQEIRDWRKENGISQKQMAELFKKSKSTINEHIKNIYKEGELIENETYVFSYKK